MALISKRIGGGLVWLLLSIGITSQSQYSAVLVKKILSSDFKHKRWVDSLVYSKFTFVKKGASFKELFDSLQRMKGYSFQSVGLDNYNIKADCNLKNASIEECLQFIETKFY